MMKTVLFVPGFQEDINSRDYAATIRAIESKGYKIKFVPIKWSRATIDDWVKEFEAVYKKFDPRDTILAGFSYGAMTCFVTATRRNPYELWLFSLSPYFAEDISSKHMKQSWLRIIGHRRVTTFNKLSFARLANKINCRTLLFSGRVEMNKFKVLENRAVLSHRMLKDNIQFIVPNADHDVTDSNYIKAIESAI